VGNELLDTESEKKLLIDKIKLDKAYMIYSDIIEKKLPFKFNYLDEWNLKMSKLLLEEANFLEYNLDKSNVEKKSPTYRYFKRGTLIRVDFGVNLGCEMSQIHFAVVLNNYDNPQNNILTVVPLTSQAGKFNLNLGSLIIDELIKKIKKELRSCALTPKSKKENEAKIRKLNNLTAYYKNCIKTTYACCSLITTISKTRILKPINEYDIIGRSICSNVVMDKIDEQLIDRFVSPKVDK
jgi:uncharacterized protein YifN (PemK superfamily)